VELKELYYGYALKPSQIAIIRHPVRSGGAEIVNIDNAYSEFVNSYLSCVCSCERLAYNIQFSGLFLKKARQTIAYR
jgi:hypothetical protein